MLRKPICPDTLKILYDNRKPLKEIAAFFDCDIRTITRRSRKLGLSHADSPDNRRKAIDARLSRLHVIALYEKGESLMALAATGDTCVEVVRDYLIRNGVRIRSRVEQVHLTMEKHGTRFHCRKARLRRAIKKLPEPLGRHLAMIYRDGCIPDTRKFAQRYTLPFEMVYKVAHEIRDCIENERR